MSTTLLTDEQIINAFKFSTTYDLKWRLEDKPQWDEIRKAQDLHTKSVLADEVRKIPNTYTQYRDAENPFSVGFEAFRQAVLKLLEAKE